MKRKIVLGLVLLLIISSLAITAFSQIIVEENKSPKTVSINRFRGLQMLNSIKEVLEQYYYDKNYRGINLDERFKQAREQVKSLETNAQIFRVIAQVLLEFNDSHTRFYPPNRSMQPEYGFSMQRVGLKTFVVNVKKDFDAAKKGLKTGDEILQIGVFQPSRENFWFIEYLLYVLGPQDLIDLRIKTPEGDEKKITVESKLRTLEERKQEKAKKRSETEDKPFKCKELGVDLVACKLYTFIIEKKDLDKMMKEVGEKKKLILDLRGNGGGYRVAWLHLLGYFFDKDVKIGDEIERKKTKELIMKTRRENIYKGELIVLIDSDSASASEIFAATIQMEKRGKVFGDVSAGSVMGSYDIPMIQKRGISSHETLIFYGMSVTVSGLIMRDGKRLENNGVIPDKPIGPTALALREKADPVLSFAAATFGVKISDKEAGEMYFLNEKPEADGEKESTNEDK